MRPNTPSPSNKQPRSRLPRWRTVLGVAFVILLTALPILAVGVEAKASSGMHTLEVLIPPEDYLILPKDATDQILADTDTTPAVKATQQDSTASFLVWLNQATDSLPELSSATLVDMKDLAMFMLCAWLLIHFRNQG